MKRTKEVDSICLKYGCSACCNPVKVNNRVKINDLPFIDREEVLIPENYMESVRLRSYYCPIFNPSTGMCNDYQNRPEICRNTKCAAFETRSKKKQSRIIEEIKAERYIRITSFKEVRHDQIHQTAATSVCYVESV
jgi:Fe-S-cluster containining protein